MQGRKAVVLVAVATIAFLLSASWAAGDWKYFGTSAFQVGKGSALAGYPYYGNPAAIMEDPGRLKVNCMAVDPDGNIYITANNHANYGCPGGVTIFKPQGAPPNVTYTRVDAELSDKTGSDIPSGVADYNLPGGITRMVVAGDGKVYALQNWREIMSVQPTYKSVTPYPTPSRILRINLDGTIDVIYEAPLPVDMSTDGQQAYLDRIGGLAVGGDGNVYWWYGGNAYNSGAIWRKHVLWRYNVTSSAVEESPTGETANGFNAKAATPDPGEPQLFFMEYVGKDSNQQDWFAIIAGMRTWDTENLLWEWNANWDLDVMGWNASPDQNRRKSVQNGYTGDHIGQWGRQCVTAMAYDPVRNKLWAGGWESDAVEPHMTILTRWDGTADRPGLIVDAGADATATVVGVMQHVEFHGAHNGEAQPSGGRYWVSCLAVNPADGRAWMSWAADANYNYAGPFGPIGGVYTAHPDCTTEGFADSSHPATDEGQPQQYHPDLTRAAHPAQVVALAFHDGKQYAVTCDISTDVDAGGGEYNLFEWTPKKPICGTPFADADFDFDVDQADFALFQACYTGQGAELDPDNQPAVCKCFDIVGPDGPAENKLDQSDLTYFEGCASGPGIPADPGCDPVGACCLGGVTCDDLTAGECRNQGGVPQGPGSGCASVACQ
jgi:hypothetical protein